MQYRIYVDYLFIEIFAWNYFVLKITNCKCWNVSSGRRILLGDFVGSVTFLLGMVLDIGRAGGMVMRFTAFLLMVLVAFPVGSLGGFARTMEKFFLTAALFGGISWLLSKGVIARLPDGWRASGTVLYGCVMYAVFRVRMCREGRKKGKAFHARLNKDDRSIPLEAIIDTGNTLYEPISKKPVCVLDSATAALMWEEDDPCRVIPYHCVGTHKGYLRGYLLPELCLEMDGLVMNYRDVYVAVSKEKLRLGNEEACLLVHPELIRNH